MTDITAKAVAWWESQRVREQGLAHYPYEFVRALVIEAFEQGYMAHNHND